LPQAIQTYSIATKDEGMAESGEPPNGGKKLTTESTETTEIITDNLISAGYALIPELRFEKSA
jgi:hypothetical protein